MPEKTACLSDLKFGTESAVPSWCRDYLRHGRVIREVTVENSHRELYTHCELRAGPSERIVFGGLLGAVESEGEMRCLRH
jgi:hypothetical protein